MSKFWFLTKPQVLILKTSSKRGIFCNKKNIVQKIECNVMPILNSRHPKLLLFLDNHVDKDCFQNSAHHHVLMIKKTVLCFLSNRLKLFCKQKNELEMTKEYVHIIVIVLFTIIFVIYCITVLTFIKIPFAPIFLLFCV